MDDQAEIVETKLLRKFKDNPSVPIGLLGLAGIVAHRLYNIKKRTKKLSLYLIELRLAAQGTLVACIFCGATYKMYNELMKPNDESKKSN